MHDILEKIFEITHQFNKDSVLRASTGNKSAGVRSRKASLELAKLFKEWRKVSVKE